MLTRTFAALLIGCLVTPPLAGATERETLQVFNDISKQVTTYSWFTIFDDVSATIDAGVVTLTGKVTMPFKAADIEKRVAKVDGVREVRNRIEALPVSQFDDDLRLRVAQAIYGHPVFWNYAIRMDPPIHIVVDRGHVTLTGVVDNDSDRFIARSLASSSLAFSVKDALKTTVEATRDLEGI
jgi:hyperosmotically inducible protein